MNIKRIAWVVLVLGLLSIPLGTALAKNLGRVTISGPGLNTPIEITDSAVANQFGPDRLDNFSTLMATPLVDPGSTYYTIDRSYLDEYGHGVAVDHLRYYPNPATGHGLIHYMGMDKGMSSNDGKWFQTHPEGEAALIKILAGHGVIIETPTPVAAPVVNLPLILGGALALALAVAAVLVWFRPRAQRAGS